MRATGVARAVTLVQCFGSALNLNVHFHMLFLEGVYLADGMDPPVFCHVAAPDANDLQGLEGDPNGAAARWASERTVSG